jgi:alpha-amylase
MKHWQEYKQEIANMVAVRKAVGINNISIPTEVAKAKDYYAVQVEGSDSKKLLCVVGTKANSYTPEDSNWKKVISGYHYAYYVQGIEPANITLPELKEDEKPKDGVYGGVPSFCTIEENEICAFFEAPMTWGSQIFTWAWMNGGDGKDYVGANWPGVEASLLGTADNGNKVFKWVSTKTTAPDNIIFSGGGNKTADLVFTNAGYYTKDGKQAVVTATGIEAIRTTPSVQNGVIYDLQGRKMGTTWDALPKGLYIVNGKKIVK